MSDLIDIARDHLRTRVTDLIGDELPRWIASDIDVSDVVAILQGGCNSGTYMPAILYADALDTMPEHAVEVLDYITERLDEVPDYLHSNETSRADLADYILSVALELWAVEVKGQLIEAIEMRKIESVGDSS